MSYRGMTDDELTSGALASADAFSAMAERYYGRIYFTALAMCRQREMAEDIAQETFLRVWLKRDTVAPPAAALQPWLCRIARNLAIDWLRSGQQRSRVLPLLPMEEMTVEPADSKQPDPRQRAQQAEQSGQLTDAVMALPDEMRQAILLHYGEGMTPSDIARLTGEAPSTVTRRLDNARKQLRAQLESGLSAGLAALRPANRQTQRVLATIAAVAALPAASQAHILTQIANTPPPPIPGQVASAAQAATKLTEAGTMNTFFSGTMITKLAATAATIAVIAGGAYAVQKFSSTGAESQSAKSGNNTVTKITSLDSQSDERGDLRSNRIPTVKAKSGVSRRAGTTNASGQDDSKAAEGETSTSRVTANAGFITVQGYVYDVNSSAPLANTLVRAVSPAEDMRYVKRSGGNTTNVLTCRTDPTGAYKLRVPLISATSTLALDAFKPGYRSLSGTWMSGGDFSKSEIPVTAGQVLMENLLLPEALYVSGTIVDENGSPVTGVNITGFLEHDRGTYGVADDLTKHDGKFAIFDFPENPFPGNFTGSITLTCNDRITTSIDNIYKFTDAERADMRISMAMGYEVNGQLVDGSGQPANDVQVTIEYDRKNGYERREGITDSEGRFSLKGLKAGEAEVYAGNLKVDQRVKTRITIPHSGELALKMSVTPEVDMSKAVNLLGMKLIDVNPELAEKYDLYTSTGILVLDPGIEYQRLEVAGRHGLEKGDQFWMAGNKKVSNLHEWVSEILRVNAMPKPENGFVNEGYKGYVRAVYNMNRYRKNGNGSNTQYMRLTDSDNAELENYLREHGGGKD